MNLQRQKATIAIALTCSAVIGTLCFRSLNIALAAPTPSATAGTAAQASRYPIYSTLFTGNTPFHHTVAELMAAGAKIVSNPANNMAANYLAQGIAQNQPLRLHGGGSVGPLYIAHKTDPAYTFSCPAYGSCNATGRTVHFPAGARAHADSDHHLSTVDFDSGEEVDGWGGYSPNGSSTCDGALEPTAACPYPCNLSPGSSGNPGTVNCSWGGIYELKGSGLSTTPGHSGNAGGYAFGLMNITAGEILQGHIDHALGITQSCLDPNTVYPSDHPGTDAKCSGNAPPFYNNFNEPQPSYGNLIHLKSNVDITALAGSASCRTILSALQTYGAYTADNNGKYGISLNLEDAPGQYGGNVPINPWFSTILPDMVAHGDATESNNPNSPFAYSSCLGKVTPQQIEIIEISPKLPPQ